MDAVLLVSSPAVTLRPMYIPSSYRDGDKRTDDTLLVSLCSNWDGNARINATLLVSSDAVTLGPMYIPCS